MKVLALDIATTTGFAIGPHDGEPRAGLACFGSRNAVSAEVFAKAQAWALEFMGAEKPDVVMLEALLPPTAMLNSTSRATRDRLCGLNAIMLACAKTCGAGEIASATVGDIRAHFIGDRTLKRRNAKAEVLSKCRELGWPAHCDDVGDALACWSYACALIEPRLALRTSPLFFGTARIASVFPVVHKPLEEKGEAVPWRSPRSKSIVK